MSAFKCEYCKSKCNGTDCVSEKIDVYKTDVEKAMSKKYQDILLKHSFFSRNKTRDILKQFYIDVELVKLNNPLYYETN